MHEFKDLLATAGTCSFISTVKLQSKVVEVSFFALKYFPTVEAA